MWTFERYQRWIDQQKEWMRPAAAAPVATDGGIIRSTSRITPPAGGATPARAAKAQPNRTSAYQRPSVSGSTASTSKAGRDVEGPEEINIDEPLDLEEIAALARK